MRRIVGVSARTAVAIALPLAGAIYLAAEEARQAMIMRYSEAISLQPVNSQLESISADLLSGSVSAAYAGVPAATEVLAPKFNAKDELAAERQAAQIPPQQPPRESPQDSHTRQIIISIPDRQLALLEDGALIKVYPVAVGKSDTPSPEGEFTVINHAVNPVYRHAGQEIAPGKHNPLGTRWMGLSLKGYGIHGTNVQSSVGKIASHGCFRMKKKDVEELYRRVQVGDVVSIRGERDELTASLFGDTKPAKTETQVASAATASAAAAGEQ